jgi:hypothetical protein
MEPQVTLQATLYKVLVDNREATSSMEHNYPRTQPSLSSSRITTSLVESAYALETS